MADPDRTLQVIEKNVDPAWFIPETIRAEHIRERNDPRTMIPGGVRTIRSALRLKLSLRSTASTARTCLGGSDGGEHGCIRLYPEDIERLFAIVPIGTPGEFVYQP